MCLYAVVIGSNYLDLLNCESKDCSKVFNPFGGSGLLVQTHFSRRVTSYHIRLISNGKAQFRRRASAVPNSIAIWFDYDTAEKQLWFRRRARVESNLEFTDAS